MSYLEKTSHVNQEQQAISKKLGEKKSFTETRMQQIREEIKKLKQEEYLLANPPMGQPPG